MKCNFFVQRIMVYSLITIPLIGMENNNPDRNDFASFIELTKEHPYTTANIASAFFGGLVGYARRNSPRDAFGGAMIAITVTTLYLKFSSQENLKNTTEQCVMPKTCTDIIPYQKIDWFQKICVQRIHDLEKQNSTPLSLTQSVLKDLARRDTNKNELQDSLLFKKQVARHNNELGNKLQITQ